MDKYLDEKEKIQKSKNLNTAQGNFKRQWLPLLGLTLITIVMFIVTFGLCLKEFTNLALILDVVVFSAAIIGLFVYRKISKYNLIKYMKNYAEHKYKNIENVQTSVNNEIISGNFLKEQSIRYKYLLSFYVKDMDCLVRNYNVEELMNISDDGYRDLTYIKIKNVFEYIYDLRKHNINNLNELMNNSEIKDEINRLEIEKFMELYIENGSLIIKKETVLHNYSKEDGVRDIDDAYNFYEKIVKKIINMC